MTKRFATYKEYNMPMSSELHSVTSNATAFIATVGSDHMIRVPDQIPSGSRVAVVMVDAASADTELARQKHFDAVMAAIRNAIDTGYDGTNVPSIEEITRLVKQARAARQAA